MFNRTTSNFFHSLENSFLFFLLKKQYQKKSYFTFSSNYYISIFVGWGPYFDNLNSMFKTLIPLASLVQGGSSTQKILQIFHSIKKAYATLYNGSGWVFCSLTHAFSSLLNISKISVFRFHLNSLSSFQINYSTVVAFSDANEIIGFHFNGSWKICHEISLETHYRSRHAC